MKVNKTNSLLFNIFFVLLIVLACSFNLNAQVSINTTNAPPDNSAMLDISSNDKGLLIPRMHQIQREAITNAATGLMVYQTDNVQGLYYWNGSVWLHLTEGVINMNTNNIPKWDGSKLINSALFDNSGNIGVGTSAPTQKLDIDGQLRLRGGAPGAGKLLTSGADGSATWSYPTAVIYNGTGLSWSGSTLNSVWTKAGNNIYNNTIGNVGIGTASPSAKLDVEGKIRGIVPYASANGILASTTSTSYVAHGTKIYLPVDSGDVVVGMLEGVFWNPSGGVIAYIYPDNSSVSALSEGGSYIMTNASAYTQFSGSTQRFFVAEQTGTLVLCMWWRVYGSGTANVQYGALKAWTIGKKQ